MRVSPRARAQKFGLFFNTSQTRQLSFNICLAVRKHRLFYNFMQQSGWNMRGAVDDSLLTRDFSPNVGPCIIKGGTD